MEKKAFLLVISRVRTVLKIFSQNYFLMKKIMRLMHGFADKFYYDKLGSFILLFPFLKSIINLN